MDSDKLIVLLTLWLMCSSANGDYCEMQSCETFKVGAPLGSSVLLHCTFLTNDNKWVKWDHNGESDLMNISSDGRVKFLDPRQGRVTAFPNQASRHNYSISISELQPSDLGCYRCKREFKCLQVELLEAASIPSKNVWLLIYMCAGVVALFLLGVGGYFFYVKCCGHKRYQVNANIPVNAGATNDNLIYENDDQHQASAAPTRNHAGVPRGQQHSDVPQPSQSSSTLYPNLNEVTFERVASQRTRQRFHFEIISRIRQASLNRHFYANQSEIRKQQAKAAQPENAKEVLGRNNDAEYQNPIYNRSTEQVNQLWMANDMFTSFD